MLDVVIILQWWFQTQDLTNTLVIKRDFSRKTNLGDKLTSSDGYPGLGSILHCKTKKRWDSMLSLSYLSGSICNIQTSKIREKKRIHAYFLVCFFPYLSMSAQTDGQHVSSSKCRQNIPIGPWWWTAVIIRNLRGKKKFVFCSSSNFSAKCYIFFPDQYAVNCLADSINK